MYNSSNPFPSSVHGFPPPSSSFYYHEKDGVYHHHPFFAGDCSSHHPTTTIAPPLLPITKVSEVVQCCDINNHNDHFSYPSSISFPSKNRVAGSKKDRHTKIFTAQGPRDRRVRLSIDISRKFFGLQDLLGFDKASKTLDWLFTKSKTAIKDLVEEMKQQHTSSSTLTDQCEEVFMGKGGDDHNLLEKTNKGKKKSNSKKPVSKCVTNGGKRKTNSSKKTTLQKQKGRFHHVNLAARAQLRAEARARARERTIEKMQKVLRNDQSSKNHVVVVGGDHHQNYCYQVQNQIQSNHQQEVKIGESAAMEQKLQNKPYSLLYTTTH